jgi:TATA-box binding protein (TBP) (component of TFIID and TFIIIB)
MRYHTVQNTSFSFLLTLEEFRASFDETKIPPSWLKITTITMICKRSRTTDVDRFRKVFEAVPSIRMSLGDGPLAYEWRLGNTKFYNQVTLENRDGFSRRSVKLFKNGTVHVTGCTDVVDCQRCVKQINVLFEKITGVPTQPTDENFQIVMINSSFTMNYKLNLLEVEKCFKEYPSVFAETHFEPGDYSAVKIKFRPSYDMKQVTTSIFNTGNIIITGAQTYKEIAYAYNLVVRTLHEYTSGRVLCSPYDVVQKFDTKYLGFRIDDLLPILRRQGHKSWCLTTENREINFSH